MGHKMKIDMLSLAVLATTLLCGCAPKNSKLHVSLIGDHTAISGAAYELKMLVKNNTETDLDIETYSGMEFPAGILRITPGTDIHSLSFITLNEIPKMRSIPSGQSVEFILSRPMWIKPGKFTLHFLPTGPTDMYSSKTFKLTVTE